MSVVADPEGVSAKILQEFIDFTDKRVLEIGCGRGRITLAIADPCSHVTAIDPLEEDIQFAIEKTPDHLKEKVNFLASGIEDFILPEDSVRFDIAMFTWSL